MVESRRRAALDAATRRLHARGRQAHAQLLGHARPHARHRACACRAARSREVGGPAIHEQSTTLHRSMAVARRSRRRRWSRSERITRAAGRSRDHARARGLGQDHAPRRGGGMIRWPSGTLASWPSGQKRSASFWPIASRPAGQQASYQRGVAMITAILIVALATILAVHVGYQAFLDQRRTVTTLAMDQGYQVAMGAEAWVADVLQKDARQSSKSDDYTEEWAMRLPPLPVDGGEIMGQVDDMQARFNLNSLVKFDSTTNQFVTDKEAEIGRA